MPCCVIMHNMTMEDEDEDSDGDMKFENMDDPIQLPHQNPATFEEFVQTH